eukprot:CAMPEP_0197690050 /NCGR_PEP_ID=MMETSP1338-20131121/107805_1 /TAXON_ID=43686 ORGANISM="Pelagodinium beii, Strain RCC1491" /NCGR_SAMPLE_ID=MMETSP1338 /ASSEMBLY_ACC=CAM_ASM_000754 /LENGTH=67 /DNA_ID=CAMNT_0043272457 /DNA_START=124 /DNA_END=328 /DNA_ORIENTATION=-
MASCGGLERPTSSAASRPTQWNLLELRAAAAAPVEQAPSVQARAHVRLAAVTTQAHSLRGLRGKSSS